MGYQGWEVTMKADQPTFRFESRNTIRSEVKGPYDSDIDTVKCLMVSSYTKLMQLSKDLDHKAFCSKYSKSRQKGRMSSNCLQQEPTQVALTLTSKWNSTSKKGNVMASISSEETLREVSADGSLSYGWPLPSGTWNQIQAVFWALKLLVITDPKACHQPLTGVSYVNLPTTARCNTDSPLHCVNTDILWNKGAHSLLSPRSQAGLKACRCPLCLPSSYPLKTRALSLPLRTGLQVSLLWPLN
ncbi:hypothetical protein GH733_010934, partial [Mirounga leonina]